MSWFQQNPIFVGLETIWEQPANCEGIFLALMSRGWVRTASGDGRFIWSLVGGSGCRGSVDPSWIFGELSHQAIDEGGQEHEACLELVQNCLCRHVFITIVFEIVNYRVSTLYKIKIWRHCITNSLLTVKTPPQHWMEITVWIDKYSRPSFKVGTHCLYPFIVPSLCSCVQHQEGSSWNIAEIRSLSDWLWSCSTVL